jgi:hypothetical protein
MKSSRCRDPKMEAYCEEVRRLEDRFYDLELNHFARRYNEAADELAKSLLVKLQFHLTFRERSPSTICQHQGRRRGRRAITQSPT